MIVYDRGNTGELLHARAHGRVLLARSGELERLVERVKRQLRDLAITSSQEPGRIFLGLDMTRAGYVTKENLREACIKHNLPCADDIIDCVCRCRCSLASCLNYA